MKYTYPGVPLFAALLLGVAGMHSTPTTAAEPETPQKLSTVEGITEYKLANGFRFLLFPDNSKPIVTVNCTIFVGSRHEGYGETGMAHLLEHLVFKGTPTFPNVPKALRDHGARFNGTTWVDRTNYYETMPATEENLEFGIQLEADRLVNSFIKREDLISEMTVVRNEFEMGENSPERVLSQRMMSTAYEWHNYGKSTIGNRSDIERVPIENLQAFYRKYYRVDNSMLVVAGKFDEAKTIALIVKYFGVLKAPATALTNTYTEEPAQDGERSVTLRRVGSVGATGVIYHIPAGPQEDFPAIEILEDCLTASPAGRVYKSLVESKKASSVSGSAFGWHDPGVLEITAKVEGNDVEGVRDALISTLETLKEKPITEEEVERSKQRFRKFNEQLLSSTDRLAVQLSEWAGAGDWRLFFLHRDQIDKVSAADVNRVAQKYLTRNNRTVGIYYPAKEAERATIPATADYLAALKDYKGRATVATGEAFDPSPENIEARVTRGTLGGLKTAILPKKTRNELVTARLSLHYGNPESLAGQTTAASLLGSMLTRGTKNMTRQQIADALDKLQTQLSVSVDAGNVSVSLKTKKDNLAASLKLLKEILREPTFPAEEFEILKRETLERYNSAKTEPTALASQALQRKLAPYEPTDVRYIPTIEEAIGRVEKVTREQIIELYTKQLGAGQGELAIVGDFAPEPALAAFGEMLQDWKSSVPYRRIERPSVAGVKGETITIETPDKANAVYIAGLTLPLMDTDADYPAMRVANYLFGGAPLASRLSIRVRGEQGLSYGIGSGFSADSQDNSGTYRVFAITNPVNMKKVEALISEETDKLLKGGVSASELDEGKRAYVESLKVERGEDGTLAAQLLAGLPIGRTFSYYADQEKKLLALTPEEIAKAVKKVVEPGRLVIVEAGDFSKKK